MNYKTKYRNNYRSQDLTGFKNLSGLTPTANTKKPLFFSQINPDLYFVGFEISATEAKGNSTTNSTNPGWFVCFEERAGEIVFGADEEMNQPTTAITNWDNLSWMNLLENSLQPKFLNSNYNITIFDTGTNQSEVDILWGSNSSDMAYAIFQKPSRVFIHSNDMII